ncbi:MAG: hypothetical protein U0414_21675 [Polyangiaceae bacterium]
MRFTIQSISCIVLALVAAASGCNSASGPSCNVAYARAAGGMGKSCATPDPASAATIGASDFAALCATYMGIIDTGAPCSEDGVLGTCISPAPLSDGTMATFEVYYYSTDGVTADEAKATCEMGGAGKWTPA